MTDPSPRPELTRDALAARIAEVALLRGTFTLRSGRTSNFYLDKYLFETQPDILRALAKAFAERLPPDTDRLAGPELGAVTLAAATAMQANLPFVLVRNSKKGYGSGKLIEGVLKPGEKVVIIEDILTTGGQIVEAAKTQEAAGAQVIKMIGTNDRVEGARDNIEAAGYRYESLFTTKDLGIG
ncbi:MAG: pyrE [Phycisphaerales bacterium]|nr:pyrE [Phycisphaerales bacterium]